MSDPRTTTKQPAERGGWQRAAPWLYALLLLASAVYICHEAFYRESTGHWGSMHGEWLALARIAGLDWFRPRWWPYWGAGSPIEYAYAPLIPMSIAAAMRLFHCSPAMALNAVTGLVYCLLPLSMYFAAWRLSRAPGYSFVAGLIYLAGAPGDHVDPGRGFGLAWFVTARRAYRLFDWDDLPHLTCLALLPIAVWLLARALEKRRPLDYVLAGAPLAGMMAANMFGFVLAGLAAVTVPLAMDKRLLPRALLVAAGAYVAISPWAPPSLLWTVRTDAILDGEADWSGRGMLALGIVVFASALVWRAAARFTREWPGRWLALFASPMILIPVLDHYFRLRFLPQPYRYQIEMEWVLALIIPFGLWPLIGRIPRRARLALAVPLLVFAGWRVAAQRQFLETRLRPVDVHASIEYRVARWFQTNMPGQRVMTPGSIATWSNAFADSPQMAGQAYNTAPNWMQQVAVYMIYTDMAAGGRAATASILWLKAFGAQAAVISGPQSPEAWRPFQHPRKFEGVLPVLWREDDTTIYRVPQASTSLAHIMRADQVVQHQPYHALDTAEVERYVAALDDPSGAAAFEWRGANRAVIRGRLQPGQVVSVQTTFDRGWRAVVNGANRRIHADGIGLMVVEPECAGECEIELRYSGGWEKTACRGASGAVLAFAVGWAILGKLKHAPPICRRVWL